MVWPFSNNQQQPQANSMNLGLAGGQQQVPSQNMGMGMGMGMQQQQQTPWGQQQYQPPPSEMDIISALITTNPLIDRWLMSDTNFQPLINLMSSVVAVSVHTMLSNARLVEDGEGYKFDFSAVQGLPTVDSVTMSKTQLQNNASNVVQQNQMQVQQMVAMANQGSMQNMLDGALADPGMIQSVGGGIGSLVRGMATGGR
tara:strand:+ start:7986 stop:8582 length:597 start_codon:yes stop_codon:yes gene_type:complete